MKFPKKEKTIFGEEKENNRKEVILMLNVVVLMGKGGSGQGCAQAAAGCP